MEATFTASIWVHGGESPWYFVTLPHELADDIDDRTDAPRPGFGSRRVEVTIGRTTWRTSIFPDAKARSFVLPVKKEVRQREGLEDGDAVTVLLRLLSSG